MTTSVTILNHGPDAVSVAPVDDAGQPNEAERQSVQPKSIATLYVYGNRNLHVAEAKPLAEPKA